MSELPSYGKVFRLNEVHPLFRPDDYIVVQEKVDGSQFSCGLVNGELIFRSKNVRQHPQDESNMFNKAMLYLLTQQKSMEEGYTYIFEYLRQPKHNTLTYGRVPRNNLVLFDIKASDGDYLSEQSVQDWAECLKVEYIPPFFSGSFSDLGDPSRFLGITSALGGPNIEGIVIKCREKINPKDDKMLKGKIVCEAFTERNTKGNAKPQRADILEDLIEALTCESRFEKGIQVLKETGKFSESLRDIGPLIGVVSTDLKEEESEWIKERLFKHFFPHIARGVTRSVPDWYKARLDSNGQ